VEAPQSSPLLSEEEYLALERDSEIKHEFYAGEMFAVAGGMPEHALITANLARGLGQLLLPRGCRVYSPDLRVKIEFTGLHTYPDVTVLCGTGNFSNEKPPALMNPTLIAEVLSESTEGFDRGTKFHHYCRIPSLTTYLLVSQNAPMIEQLVRKAEFQWEHQVVSGLEKVLELPAFGVTLALSEIFAGIVFAPHSLRVP
jgi:Uma2 family endonuclease